MKKRNISKINPKAIRFLKEAGWYDGRKIDITQLVQSLEEKGIVVFEAARNFLEEFGGLDIKMADSYFGEHEFRNTIFLDETSIYRGSQELSPFNTKCICIGRVCDHEYHMWIDENGIFYHNRDLIADNIEALWNSLLTTENSSKAWKFLSDYKKLNFNNSKFIVRD